MYRVKMLASAYAERRKLPGVVRQRIKNIIGKLNQDARPDNSIELQLTIDTAWEARRIRLDSWRILYAVDDEFEQVVVLAIRQRPPYDYADLTDLLMELE